MLTTGSQKTDSSMSSARSTLVEADLQQFSDTETDVEHGPLVEKRWLANEMITPSLSSHFEGIPSGPPSGRLREQASSSFSTRDNSASQSKTGLVSDTNSDSRACAGSLSDAPSSTHQPMDKHAPPPSTKGRRIKRRMAEMFVDVESAEWWDEGADQGPGVKDSRVGRYDSWL